MATDEKELEEDINSSPEEENLCSKLSKRQGKISNRLLDIFNDLWDNEQLIPKVYVGGSLDSVIGWENTVPNPQYIVPKRRKSTIQEESVVEESAVEAEDKLQRNYELEFVNCPPWKIGVEPFTYRYMGNNGRYRAYKLARKLVNSNRAKVGHVEMGNLNPDKRLLQREIQRELRREFDTFVKTEREVSALFRQKELAAANLKQKKRRQEKTENQSERDEKKSTETEQGKGKVTSEDDNPVTSNSETPRSNLSILSSQTPLPPITIPLLSSEKEETQVKQLSRSMDDLSTIKAEGAKKEEKLWHIPPSVNVDNQAELRGRSRRFEWSAQAVVLQSSSEPPSRISPRVSRNNKSAPLAKIDTNSGYQLNSGYRLQKLPTISDFNDNEYESSQEYVGQKEVLLGQGYQIKSADQGFIGNKGPRRRDDIVSKHQCQDDTMSIISEPLMPRSPVLQGTAYDIRKLRASANQFHQLYPDTVSLVGDIRSVYNQNQGYPESNSTRDNVVSAGDYQREGNGPPDFSMLVKQKGEKIKEDTQQVQDLTKIISTKQYVNTKTRTGLNPYLRKPKPGTDAIHQQLITMEQPDIAETLATIPLNEPTPGLSNHVRRGDVMPEMMVRRAEISLTNKRVI